MNNRKGVLSTGVLRYEQTGCSRPFYPIKVEIMPIDFSAARTHMVQSQLAPSGVVRADILDSFFNTPRDVFVPAPLRDICYADKTLSMGHNRYMSEPMILGRMIENLGPCATDHILCLGGLSGYAACILARLAAHVTDAECDSSFDTLAAQARTATNTTNITRKTAPFHTPLPTDMGPYDGILIEGALATPPDHLFPSLKPGGRIVAIITPEGRQIGQITVFEKTLSGHVTARPIFDVTVPYLPECGPTPRFKFG
jgi:protein-L-isoaspartate(D-aspartate) O-methyltransferase